MTAPTTTRADTIAADIRQLVKPIHLAAGRRIIAHPPLLAQLRAAAVPGQHGGHGATRHNAPGSREPVRLDAVDVLSEIYVGISAWHARLRLPSPPPDQDWQMATLTALADAATTLDPQRSEWLAVEVHTWWADAATVSGWDPRDLVRLR